MNEYSMISNEDEDEKYVSLTDEKMNKLANSFNAKFKKFFKFTLISLMNINKKNIRSHINAVT